MRRFPFLSALLPFAAALCPAMSAKNVQLTLPPANVDRAGQVIVFVLPPAARGLTVVQDGAGRRHPLQTDADGTARLVVPWQRAGETLTLSLLHDAAPPTGAGVVVMAAGGDWRVTVGGAPVLHYRVDRNVLPRSDIQPEVVRAGYIHPVFSPAGQLVTDDYPANHVHHHGIWTPWTKTSFQGRAPDFWNMQNRTGAEDLVAVDRTWSGAVHGGLEARLQMIDRSAPRPVAALNETWRLVVYAIEGAPRPVRLFDLVVTQTCATADPLVLPKYHYGSFGLRGAGAWNGPGEAVRFLTSEGITDRLKGKDTRARWVYLGGPVAGGGLAGTTTLGHPGNFRAPLPVRLHPDMPYFSFVPQQLGEFRIEPGQAYVTRYRFVVCDGEPDRALLEAYWHGYSFPAEPRCE
jgi:hypothetical protein